ncbi:MAG: type II secretion system F family protein [Planctomycetota bacterium]|nr:type II secretion system F family protein [Planctomycetota bacterium]
MVVYRYAAKDSSGKTVQGTVQAKDKNEAVTELRRQNLVVLKVERGGGVSILRSSSASGGKKSSFFKAKPRGKSAEVVIFTRQLATMIGAGLSLLESLEVLADQAESPGMKMTCERLVSELRGGSDLSAAMATCPKVFSSLYVSMVTAGEASGQMDVILDRLAEYTEATAALKREIRSAMTYPVVSMVLVSGITAFLMIGVVPGFREVFEGLGAELNPLTDNVLKISDIMKHQWYWCLLGMFIAAMGAWAFKQTKRGSYLCDKWALYVPVFGPLLRKLALARFSRTFATLIRSGVPILATLDIVADTAGNQVVARVVREAKESVRNGNLLSEPLGQSKVFPPMVTKMIAIGERSGALEALLEKIAEFYDSQVEASVKALTSLIEPILISLMGAIVGTVVLSVFLPILDIVGELGAQNS